MAAHPFEILLVEDSPDEAYLAKALIERLGPYRVVVVQDGVRALEAAEASPPGLVLTDLNLPGIDGFQLIADLRRRSPATPVVAVTGYRTPAHLEGALRAGAVAVLEKPLDEEALRAQLDRLRPPAPPSPRPSGASATVIAVGYRPGDLELGCGGALLEHRRAGSAVRALLLSGRPAALDLLHRIGGEAFGIDAEDSRSALAALADAVRTLAPSTVYVPSPRDGDATRAAVYEAARDALRSVPEVLGYATVSSTLDFRPERFTDVTVHLEAKRGAVTALAEAGVPGVPSSAFVEAHAVYWGRLAGFRPCEPFEILRSTLRS